MSNKVEREGAGRVEKGGGGHVILGDNLGNLSIDNFVIKTRRNCIGINNSSNVKELGGYSL